jgi:predicted nucleotidyltransferase
MATFDLATFFFGAYRSRVLALLLLHPEESFHLREIARLTGKQPGTLRRELIALQQAGVLESEKVGNQLRYRAATTFPIYDELRGILRKTAGVVDVLREALMKLGPKVTVALVYGSVAAGVERRSSDIDIMVVGNARFEDIVRVLVACQHELRREINPTVYTLAEFRRKAFGKDSFVARVMSGPKLFLIGSENDIGKPGSHRKTAVA